MVGGEIMELTFTTAMIIPATIAIVNRIKDEIPSIKSYFYTLMSIAVAAALYGVTFAPAWVSAIIILGFGAAGIFDIREGKANILK